MQAICVATLVASLLAPALSAQALARYDTFGTGCPGTGTATGLPGVVLPKGHDTKMGNYNNWWGVGLGNQRYQQVFRGSDIGKPLVITGYQLRPDEASFTSTGGQTTYTITMGHTTFDSSSLTTDFAKNYNSSRGPGAQVFQGNVNLPSMPSSAPRPGPNDWQITVKFARPFVFTYSQGINLLFELANTGTITSASVSGYKDGASGAGEGVTRLVSNASSTASTGTLWPDTGLIMKFNTPSSGAVPGLTATGTPGLGQSMTVHLKLAAPNTAALLALGFSKQTWGSLPLPADLQPLGAPGCQLLVAPDLLSPFGTDAQGASDAKFSVPNVPAFRGLQFHQQWIVFDPNANGLGLVFSNGGTGSIG